MGWLKGSGGSTGSLALAENSTRSEGLARPSGWTGKQAGRPQSVALQRRSGGVALPAWTGGPTGTVGPPVRVAQPGSKARKGRWGHWDSANFPVRGVAPNAAVHAAVLLGNWQFGNIYRLSPTASRPLTIAKVLYQI